MGSGASGGPRGLTQSWLSGRRPRAKIREPDGQGSPEVTADGGDDDAVVVESHVAVPRSWMNLRLTDSQRQRLDRAAVAA